MDTTSLFIHSSRTIAYLHTLAFPPDCVQVALRLDIGLAEAYMDENIEGVFQWGCTLHMW